jgi:hypothetical protein
METERRRAGWTSAGNATVENAGSALATLPAKEQPAVVSQTVVAPMQSDHLRYVDDPDGRQRIECFCSDMLAGLRGQSEGLRFQRSHFPSRAPVLVRRRVPSYS